MQMFANNLTESASSQDSSVKHPMDSHDHSKDSANEASGSNDNSKGSAARELMSDQPVASGAPVAAPKLANQFTLSKCSYR